MSSGEAFIKGRLYSRDVVADYLEQSLAPTTTSPDQAQLTKRLVIDGLDLVLRAGQDAVEQTPNILRFKTPAVSYGFEVGHTDQIEVPGHITLEAKVRHRKLPRGLLIISQTVINLYASPEARGVREQRMAMLTRWGLQMQGRGSEFTGDRGDYNYMDGLINYALRDYFLNSPSATAEQKQDLAADRLRQMH